MLVLVHIDITPPHTPLPVFQRIGERTIPYSWKALYVPHVHHHSYSQSKKSAGVRSGDRGGHMETCDVC
ncbi:hypothetical protein TNCV_1581521 [Trichonephila clavipes]|nr:hypothetical protein TNCV_1581521 [Trichonephila clavipes]